MYRVGIPRPDPAPTPRKLTRVERRRRLLVAVSMLLSALVGFSNSWILGDTAIATFALILEVALVVMTVHYAAQAYTWYVKYVRRHRMQYKRSIRRCPSGGCMHARTALAGNEDGSCCRIKYS